MQPYAYRNPVARKGAAAPKHHIFGGPYGRPLSPDLDPIEQVFAKLKAVLRKAGARTVDDPWRAIGNGLDQFSPAEYSV